MRLFGPKKKVVTNPVQEKKDKKGASSNIVNIDEERNLVFGITYFVRGLFRAHVWSHGLSSRVQNVFWERLVNTKT